MKFNLDEKWNLCEENERLKGEVARLQHGSLYIANKVLLEENRRLREENEELRGQIADLNDRVMLAMEVGCP